ncbi:MAG: hypothetical protein K8W52_05460 [Deltaproteobacteria bacterium]|nr:hypothetical protein [Deltaproteobacteria bacterium]
MEAAKKNADRLNLVGIVVIGVCGAVLIYVSIVLLQAFYMNDSAEITTMADYGGQDSEVKSLKATQFNNITQVAHNAPAEGKPDTFRIGIEHAMDLVVADAKTDAANLVPSIGKADKATVKPIFGRPQKLDAVPPPADPAAGSGTVDPAAGSGSAAPAAGSGSGSAAPAAGSGSGSAAPAAGSGSTAPAAGSGAAAPAPAPAAPAPAAPAAGGSGH